MTPRGTTRKLRWRGVYSETELYKAALRLYTKPLFSWRKALSNSTDRKTLYDFARRGLQNLEAIHKTLSQEKFHFRPGVALHYNFNRKRRILYLYPWEERVVDLLLYRLLNQRLHGWFTSHSYAYRCRAFGLDLCQKRIALTLAAAGRPLYLVKRDITEFFASIDHEILLQDLASLIEPTDYLFRLVQERVQFAYEDGGGCFTAARGVPFGTAAACLFANVYLTRLDRRLSKIGGNHYFRYADDLLVISRSRENAAAACEVFDQTLSELKLRSNPGCQGNMAFADEPLLDDQFYWTAKFRHLGLEFRASGSVGLSRDKFRKICNIFRFALRRRKARFRLIKDPHKRALLAIDLTRRAIDTGVRNVAIIDYYLKHISDEGQLKILDRWLAEEVLFYIFGGGHKKSHFRHLSFKRLRQMGLPSLVHRRRLIRHRHLESPFFIWKSYQATRGVNGAAARSPQRRTSSAPDAFSPFPKAAAENSPREREGLPVDGRY